MKIGLYGLPCAGKSFVLNNIDYLPRIEGSVEMKRRFPDFETANDNRKNEIRKEFAKQLKNNTDSFIMDGHYAFGENIVFTETDGELYDVFLYLYIEPSILSSRMINSEKNKKYAKMDIEKWQDLEVKNLRKYCHLHNKDFYLIDNTSLGYFESVESILMFIKSIVNGFSCVNFAIECVKKILENEDKQKVIKLLDGDKTISELDTSNLIYNYTTNIFDNNFYTGYQVWLHKKEFKKKYVNNKNESINRNINIIKLNDIVTNRIDSHSYILTSGCGHVWNELASKLKVECFYGNEMSADTKYFITKFLKKAGKVVEAYGDSMNEYYMLKEANKGHLIVKSDGTVSKSLKNIDIGGIEIVRIGENERS